MRLLRCKTERRLSSSTNRANTLHNRTVSYRNKNAISSAIVSTSCKHLVTSTCHSFTTPIKLFHFPSKAQVGNPVFKTYPVIGISSGRTPSDSSFSRKCWISFFCAATFDSSWRTCSSSSCFCMERISTFSSDFFFTDTIKPFTILEIRQSLNNIMNSTPPRAPSLFLCKMTISNENETITTQASKTSSLCLKNDNPRANSFTMISKLQ